MIQQKIKDLIELSIEQYNRDYEQMILEIPTKQVISEYRYLLQLLQGSEQSKSELKEFECRQC